MFLKVPTISPEVPASIVQGTAGKHQLALALSMSKAGLIKEADLAHLDAGEGIPVVAFLKLINDAWERATAELFNFDVLQMQVMLEVPSGLTNSDACIVVDVIGHDDINVGKILTSINDIVPSVAPQILNLLNNVLNFGEFSYTPIGAYEMAQLSYWEGEVDEEWVKKSYGENYGEEEAAAIPTKQELFGKMPDWAITYVHADRASFGDAAKLLSDTQFSDLLNQIVRLVEVGDRQAKGYQNGHCSALLDALDLDDCDIGCAEPLVALYWDADNDNLFRIFDDNFQRDLNCGKTNLLGGIPFDFDPDGFLAMLQRLQTLNEYLVEIDKTLFALKVLENKLE